jgi:predicted membrane protein
MLFGVIVALFVITMIIKLIQPSLLETNLIFYMIVFMLLMTQMNLSKHSFHQGYFSLSDETKLELLFAIKAFIICFVFLMTWGSTTFFDFNLEKAHEQTKERVNMTLQLIGG